MKTQGNRESTADTIQQQTALRYCRRGIQRYPAGLNHNLIRAVTTGRSYYLPTFAAQVLECCRCFLDLGEHSAQISKRLNLTPDQAAIVNEILSKCAADELLISECDVLRPHSGSRAAAQNIGVMGIVTANRPERLKRCVSSIATNVRDHGHQVRFHVVDDTVSPDGRQRNLWLLRSLQNEFQIDVVYLGVQERLRFAESLISLGLDPEVVQFACGDASGIGVNGAATTGANRNALLMSTVGELLVSVDDDTVCSLVVTRDTSTVALTSSFNPMSITYFPDREALHRAVTWTSADFLGLHAKALGGNVGALLSSFDAITDIDRTDLTDALVNAVEKRSGSVLVTQCGLVGDSACGSPEGLLMVSGRTRERALASEFAYAVASTSREVLSLVDNYTLTDAAFVMSYAVGLDNRGGLAPFLPILRNQDGVFGGVTRKCFPDSLTCHVPCGIFHDPPGMRSYEPGATWRQAGLLRLADLVLLAVASHQIDGASTMDTASRLRRLGHYLVELASASSEEFWARMHHMACASLGKRAVALELRKRQYPDAPAYWVSDVDRHVDNLRRRLPNDECLVPWDLARCVISAEVRSVAKELVRRYGRLLEAWPDIVAACQMIREKGRDAGARPSGRTCATIG